MTPGQRINELRTKFDLTVDELSSRIGKSRATVYRYEANDIDIPLPIVQKIAKVFGVSPGYIMCWTDDPQHYEDVKPPEAPKTPEARVVSFGMDQLPQEDREQILNVLRAMYAKRPELFRKDDDNDDA